MYDRLYSKGSFLSKVKQKIENKIVGTAKDIRFGMDSALDGYDMMASMNQGPMHTMIGSMAGGMFSGSMLDKLEMKLREKYGSKIANLKSVKGINNAAKMFNNDPALLLSNISSGFGKQRDKLDNVQYDPTKGFLKKGMAKLGSSLFGGLEDMTRFRGTNTLNTEIKGDSMASAESPAIFDKKTQRSIIDVIPMYLARILQQTTRVATHFGAPEVGLLKYDYNARLLVTDTKAKEKLTKSVRSFLTRGEGNSKRDTLGLLDNQMTDNDKDGLIEYLDRSGADINSAEDLTKALSRDDIPPALKEAAASVKRKLERISKKDRNNYDNRINATFNTGKKLDELIRKLMLLGTTYGSSKKEVESLKIIFTIHIMTGGELKLSQLKDLVQKLPTHVASNMRILKFIKSLYGDVETQADAAVTLSYISKILKNETISNPDALLRLIDDLGFESRDSMIEAGIMTRDDDTDDLKVNAPMIVSLLLGTDTPM